LMHHCEMRHGSKENHKTALLRAKQI
jgi:hypothetical protein